MDDATVVRLVAAFGHTIAEGYVRHIANGYRRPSFDLARVLSRVTAGVVSVEQFMDFKRSAA